MDRIPGFEPVGCRFESCRLHHFCLLKYKLIPYIVPKVPNALCKFLLFQAILHFGC